MTMPLTGIRVLELGYYVQAPVCTRILADFGAEVIKIEEPGVGDPARGVAAWGGVPTDLGNEKNWLNEHHNTNKKSITVNLKSEKGRAIIYRLVEKTDVFCTNLRMGVIKKRGLDYETLSRYNPKLIYATGTGYGRKGPNADRIGYDYLIRAKSGHMLSESEVGQAPVSSFTAPADMTGSLIMSMGILLALMARDRLGISQELDASLYGAGLYLGRIATSAYLFTGKEMNRPDRARASNPFWNHYQCSDGEWIAMAMLPPDKYWSTFCKAIGALYLEKDPKFMDWKMRQENAEELIAILDTIFATKTSDEWLDIMKKAGDLGCEPLNRVAEAVNDPQTVENDLIVDFEHPVLGKVRMPGPVLKLMRTPGQIVSAAPEVGQHTEEVLLDIGGYSWEEITELKDQGAI